MADSLQRSCGKRGGVRRMDRGIISHGITGTARHSQNQQSARKEETLQTCTHYLSLVLWIIRIFYYHQYSQRDEKSWNEFRLRNEMFRFKHKSASGSIIQSKSFSLMLVVALRQHRHSTGHGTRTWSEQRACGTVSFLRYSIPADERAASDHFLLVGDLRWWNELSIGITKYFLNKLYVIISIFEF